MESNNLIIITTAITRGDLHNKSIKKFYEVISKYNTYKQFEIFHIINIDQPEKLKNKYSLDYSEKLLNSIIPENINKTIIINKDNNYNPSFGKAYNSVVLEIYKCDSNII